MEDAILAALALAISSSADARRHAEAELDRLAAAPGTRAKRETMRGQTEDRGARKAARHRFKRDELGRGGRGSPGEECSHEKEECSHEEEEEEEEDERES